MGSEPKKEMQRASVLLFPVGMANVLTPELAGSINPAPDNDSLSKMALDPNDSRLMLR